MGDKHVQVFSRDEVLIPDFLCTKTTAPNVPTHGFFIQIKFPCYLRDCQALIEHSVVVFYHTMSTKRALPKYYRTPGATLLRMWRSAPEGGMSDSDTLPSFREGCRLGPERMV